MKKNIYFGLLILIICPSAWAMKIGPVNTDNPGHISFILYEYPNQIADESYFQLFLDNQFVTDAEAVGFIGIPGKAMSLVICADVSAPITKEELNRLGGAFRFLVGAAKDRPEDRLALVSFAKDVKVVSSFQATRKNMTHTSIELQSGGKAQLGNALFRAMGLFTGPSLSERRRIIIISTKKDFNTTQIPQNIATQADALNVSIDVIKPGRIDSEIETRMQALSASTGGQFIQIDSGEKSLKYGIGKFYMDLASRRSLRITFSYDVDSDAGYAKEAGVGIALPGQACLTLNIKGKYALPKRKAPVTPGDGQKSLLPEPKETLPAQKESAKAVKKESWFKQTWILLAIAFGLIMAMVVISLYLRQKKENKTPDQKDEAKILFDKDQDSHEPGHPSVSRNTENTIIGGYTYPEPSENKPTAELVGIEGPGLGNCMTINKKIFSIGCAPEKDFCICDDVDVSDHHAYLRYEQGSLFIFNQSKSGTFVNNTKIEDISRALEIGDKIKIGASIFEVREYKTRQDDDGIGM